MSEQKTVLYTEIDGHKIITGIDRPTVDGVATNKVVLGDGDSPGLIHDTDEYQAVEAKKAEYYEAMRQLSALQGKYKKGSKVPREAQEQWNHASAKARIYQDELQPLARALDDKVIALRRSDAVYFEPRAGEVAMDASEVDGLIEAVQGKPAGVLIDLRGGEVFDNRGQAYYRRVSKKWQRTHIVKLGDTVPGDAVTEPTESEWDAIEKDRVSALPAEVKAKERDKAMTGAMARAAGMRSELEIQADPDALTKSQDWYHGDVKRIEGLYG